MGTLSSMAQMAQLVSDKKQIIVYASETFERNNIHPEDVEWDEILRGRRLTLEFLIKYQNHIKKACGIRVLSNNPYITDTMIREFVNELDFEIISKNRTISRECVNKLLSDHSVSDVTKCILLQYFIIPDDMLNMLVFHCGIFHICDTISQCQSLSETFINDHSANLNWELVSQYQSLSLDFIKEHEELIEWRQLSHNKYLTDDIKIEYKDKFDEIDGVLYDQYREN